MYNKQYYEKRKLGSYNSARIILKYLQSLIPIISIIDFGCGMGTWCQAARELNIVKIIGIDNHTYDSNYMLITEDEYIQKDLRYPVNLNIGVDLVISVEVAEHIDEKYSGVFIENLCRHGKIVLFSAALPHQGGVGHINEKPCSFWRNLFYSNKYLTIDCLRPYLWDNKQVKIWYRNNCILYVKDDFTFNISNKSSHFPPFDIIHPDMLKRILERR